MKVIITGGNGYIGARLSLYLADRGLEVIPICFPAIPDNKEWKGKMASVYEGDLRKDETIAFIAGLNPDVIIHLVSLDHYESEKDPKFVNEINVLPTWRLLDTCSKHGLKKFIYFSTIHVYGKNQNGVITEQTSPTPANTYGLTHLLSEEVCNYFNRKSDTTTCVNVRLSNSYGEPVFADAKCWDLVINNLCLNAYRDKKIILRSDGRGVRDFIHYNMICENVYQLLYAKTNLGEDNTIHFSSGESISMIQAAKLVQEVYDKKFGNVIDLYINNFELVNEIEDLKKIDYQISNYYIQTLFNSNYIDLRKGIDLILTYLEKNNKNI